MNWEMDAIKPLKKFNEKYRTIHEREFYRYFLKNPDGVKISVSGKPDVDGDWEVTRTFPDDTAIDSLAVHFGYFLKKHDECSIDKLKRIYTDLPMDDRLREAFFEMVRQWDGILDMSASQVVRFSPDEPEKELTWRDIMNAVLFGKILHEDGEDKRIYSIIARGKMKEGIVLARFSGLMITLLQILGWIYGINLKVIDSIENNTK
jgi:hypothetical protein